jgi:predicted TIM-barrel fold metal-dependent hydrolase
LHEFRLDPFWEVCSELDMPAHRHSAVLGDAEAPETGPQSLAIGSYEGRFFSRRALGHLILGGVFQRHPDLKFVMTEVGSSWVPAALVEMDAWCHDATEVGSLLYPFAHRAVERLELLPSEYFHRNCFLGASLMEPDVGRMLQGLSADRIMWGADYPHHEGTFPYTDIALRLNFSVVPEPEVRMMTSTVAASVYGFDLDYLQTIADGIGPTVHRVATPVPTDEIPSGTMCPTFTGSWSRSRSGL